MIKCVQEPWKILAYIIIVRQKSMPIAILVIDFVLENKNGNFATYTMNIIKS